MLGKNKDKIDIKTNIKVKIWLLICCALVSLMVWIGGITRLTGSGLSITEWQPISGVVPPFGAGAWQEVYEKYQATPEYRLINYGITLAQFKKIYWTEYIHRLLARSTGLFFILPFLYFAFARYLGRRDIIINLFIAILMALQALVGWYMVRSGLQDSPQVSHYWLAFHLGMAFIIFFLLFFQVISSRDMSNTGPRPKSKLLPAISMLVFLQIILGALLAGLHGGLIYNTFPLMEGELIPVDVFKNISRSSPLKNIAFIQFLHRWLAIIILALTLIPLTKTFQKKTLALFSMALLQVSLGIITLLMQAHIVPASLHQIAALLLFSASLYVSIKPPYKI